MDNKETSIAIINMMITKYDLGSLLSEFCDGIEVVENDDFYDVIMQYTEIECQKDKTRLCKQQFEYIDATVIMPQKINRMAYILLKMDLSLESSIRKTIHEMTHLVHRCIITKKMMLSDLYEIEENRDYKLLYYLDEFLTKKKELIIYYDLLLKNKKIVDDNTYIETMTETFELVKKSSSDSLNFMRNALFAIAETMAYISIFPDLFPEHFIEDISNMSNINNIIEILNGITQIDFFITHKTELKKVIKLLENNYYTSHQ